MYDTENLIPKEIKLIEGQIDIILKALELYAFNLHNTWGIEVDNDLNELRNSLIFHTYESLLAQKNKEYKISYDSIKEYKLEQLRKKKRCYYINKEKKGLNMKT